VSDFGFRDFVETERTGDGSISIGWTRKDTAHVKREKGLKKLSGPLRYDTKERGLMQIQKAPSGFKEEKKKIEERTLDRLRERRDMIVPKCFDSENQAL